MPMVAQSACWRQSNTRMTAKAARLAATGSIAGADCTAGESMQAPDSNDKAAMPAALPRREVAMQRTAWGPVAVGEVFMAWQPAMWIEPVSGVDTVWLPERGDPPAGPAALRSSDVQVTAFCMPPVTNVAMDAPGSNPSSQACWPGWPCGQGCATRPSPASSTHRCGGAVRRSAGPPEGPLPAGAGNAGARSGGRPQPAPNLARQRPSGPS